MKKFLLVLSIVSSFNVFANEAAHSSKTVVPATSASTGATESLTRLIDGNHRFVEGKALHGHQDSATRHELAAGQKPFAIVLSCSDSRVPPEVIFDQGLGDLFIVRTAGETLDPVVIGSIEYAVEHLHAGLLVVMGHESCGAVAAALKNKGESTGSASLDAIIRQIKPNIASFAQAPAENKLLRGPVNANVDGVTRDLLKRSNLIRELVQKGHLQIVRGIYALDAGSVEFNPWKN